MAMRLIFLTLLIFPLQVLSEPKNSQYFVFVGKKISLEAIPPKENQRRFDFKFLAKYKILMSYRGTFNGDEIEFTVFNHRGIPPFSQYEHVLLYVEMHGEHYYHAKYQHTPLYKTQTGRWAGAYSAYDYNHPNNKNTTIKPEKINFIEPVTFDISGRSNATVSRWFPEPYYKIADNKAIAVYGNYIEELFLLKQNGVLKARGDFQ